MDEERLAEIDRQIEALGEPATSVEALLADLGGLDLDETDAILDELAEGQDFDVELAPLPRVTTSVSEPPTGVSASPPMMIDELGATEEHAAFDEPEFDLPPPSEMPMAVDESEENVLGTGLDELGKSEIPEPLSASLAAWIDPPDSESPSSAPEAFAEMPPNPKLPELDGGFEDEEVERTGLFSQEDIDAIRASQPPPPRSTPPPRSAPPSASASLVGSIPPPVPAGPPPAASAPPPPIPVSMAPPADEDLEILDDDDFELMIEEDGFDSDDSDDSGGEADDAISELLGDSFDSFDDSNEESASAEPSEPPEASDEPVIREPEVDAPAAAAESSEAAEPDQADDEADAAEADTEGEAEGEDEEGEKKGFFKKLFG